MNWAIVKDPTILTTAVVYGLLLFIATAAGILGFWLALIIGISLWRFCYSVLRAVAQGRKHVSAPDIDSINLVGEMRVLWHFIAFPGLVLATAPFQPVGMVVALLVALAFPASAALMVLTLDLGHAFNPVAIVNFARTIGSDYVALVLGLLAMLIGANLIVGFVAFGFGFLSTFPILTVEIWALLSCFALIGSVLRKHRLDFVIPGEVVPPEERVRLHQHEKWRKDLDIAYVGFRSGLLASGYQTLRDLVARENDSLEVNHWLVENMLDWQDKTFALEVAAKLMPRLLAREDGVGALALYRRCRRHDPEFLPLPEEAEQLAAYAEAFGQTGLANELSYNRATDAGS